MLLQIRKFKVKQGNPSDICRQAVEGVPPILKKIPGFVNYYVVNNEKQNSLFSITIFENAEGLKQAFDQVRQWSRENVRGELSEPELIEGDVVYASTEQKGKAA